MNQYLIEVEIKTKTQEETLSLVQQQKKHLTHLMAEGTVSFFGFSMEKPKVWISIHAETAYDAMELISPDALQDGMAANIHELSFVAMSGSALPAISLN